MTTRLGNSDVAGSRYGSLPRQWILASAAGTLFVAAVCVCLSTAKYSLAFALVAFLIWVVLGAVPPAVMAPLLIFASLLSNPSFIIPFNGINLRPETVLLPAALVGLVVRKQAAEFVQSLASPVALALEAFISLNLVSSLIASPSFASSLSIVIWYTVDLLVVCYALTAFRTRPGRLFGHLKACAILAAASGIVGWFILVFTGQQIGGLEDATYGPRAVGLLYEPNILAGYCALWAVITLTKGSRLSKSDWLSVILCVLCIPLTSTRAAIVAAGVGLAIIIITRPRVLRRVAPLAVTAALAVVAAGFLFPSSVGLTLSKFSDFTFTNQTSTYRYDLWTIAFQDLSHGNLLFGLGTDSFGQRHLLRTDYTGTRQSYLGNMPLTILYDTGILGCIVAVMIVVIAISRGSRRSLSRRVALVATFAIIGTACNPLFLAQFWLLGALSVVALPQKTRTALTAFASQPNQVQQNAI